MQGSRRRPVRGILHVSGDGLRVVDDDTKGLIVDQTIEKVSFCAPDRNHERGFSYICRDGTTRRWMCHGFLATKDSGERLSHAVGCAFTVCLERKQRRDTECSVTMTFDSKNSTFTRNGSFRKTMLTERLGHNERAVDTGAITTPSAVVPPQPKPHNPFAIERPHATPSMLERQGSFRGFSNLNHHSPFKRQMSLRLSDLPSNTERQKSFLEPITNGQIRSVSPIPEVVPQTQVPVGTTQQQIDNVSALCKELSQGLSLLSRNDNSEELNFNLQTISKTTSDYVLPSTISADGISKIVSNPITFTTESTNATITVQPSAGTVSTAVLTTTTTAGSDYISMLPSTTTTIGPPVAHISPNRHRTSISGAISMQTGTMESIIAPPIPEKSIEIIPSANPLPKPEQWLGQVVKNASPSPRRAPSFNIHSRTKSLSNATDPFDAEWVSNVAKTGDDQQTIGTHHSTNPFISPPKPPAQSFQVQL